MIPARRARRALASSTAILALAASLAVSCGDKGEKSAKRELKAPETLPGEPTPGPKFNPDDIAKMSLDQRLAAARQSINRAKILADAKSLSGADLAYADADKLFAAALGEAQAKKDPRYFAIMKEIAFYHYSTRFQPDKAVPLFVRLVTERETAAPDSPDLAMALNDLGNVYSFLAKDADAEASFKRALDVINKTPAAAEQRASVIRDYAFFLRKLKREDDAKLIESGAAPVAAPAAPVADPAAGATAADAPATLANP